MQNGLTLKNAARGIACVAMILGLIAGRADAGRFARTTVAKKAQAPAAQPKAPATAATPAPAKDASAAKAPAPAPETAPPTKAAKPAAPAAKAGCAPKQNCCQPCCDNRPPVKTVLHVVNPLTCCTVDVPVCLPACCEGEPTVCSRCGIILCRSVVTYDWCCGYRVIVRFRACGDVVVAYRG